MDESRGSADLNDAVDGWYAAVADVLTTARRATPLSVAMLDGLSFSQSDYLIGLHRPAGESISAVEHGAAQVGAVIDRSEDLIAVMLGEASTQETAASEALAVLTSTLLAGGRLLAAGEEREVSIDVVGLEQVDDQSSDAAVTELDRLKAIIYGAPLPGTAVPADLRTELEKLETAGGVALGDLVQDALLWELVESAAKGLGDLDRTGHLGQAIDSLKAAVNWLQAQGLRLVNWSLTKLRDLVPMRFREEFDAKVESMKEAAQEGAVAIRDNAFGVACGRLGTERAWQLFIDGGGDVGPATLQLEPVVSVHVRRIEQVSNVQRLASGSATIILAIVKRIGTVAGPWGRIVMGALALAVLAFVSYQTWDGFAEVERLVR